MEKVKDFITNHKVAVIISSILIVVIIGLAIGIPCGLFFAPKHGKQSTYVYDKTADFDLSKDGYVIKKSDDKDFKVLNIADLQMSEVYSSAQNKRNYDLVKKLVEQEKPDLLTFTGDNFWLFNAKNATKKFIKNIDSLGVPWAPVFGNHEPETEVDTNWIMEQFLTAENCIFNYGENANRNKDLAKGPKNIDGIGNYVINVLNSENKLVHTIFMIDSHSNNGNQYPEYYNNYIPDASEDIEGLDGWFKNGAYMYRPYTAEEIKENNKLTGYKAVGTKYDYIKQSQIEWYAWAVAGIAKINGGTVVPSSAYFHIPLPEFNIAYALFEKTFSQYEAYDGREAIDGNFGLNRENVCSPYYNSGFFDVIKMLGSTKDIIVGHDHVNNSSIVFDGENIGSKAVNGIRLTYGLKTGDGCYWWDDEKDKDARKISGGTTIEINGVGGTKTTHKYLPFE